MASTSMGQLCMPMRGSSVAGGVLLEAWMCCTGILLEASLCETGMLLKSRAPSPAPSAGGQLRSKSRECDLVVVRRLFGVRHPAPWEFMLSKRYWFAQSQLKKCMLAKLQQWLQAQSQQLRNRMRK